MTPREAAAAIDAIAVPVARQRLETLGEQASGAGPFYAVRLDRGTLFADYDIRLAEALLADPTAPRTVHEIGGGFGNLSLLLTAVGFETVCLEMSAQRHAGAIALLEALQSDMPQMKGCRILKAAFPAPKLSPQGAMAIATNLVASTSPEVRARIIAGLKRHPVAILDIDRFLTMTSGAEDRSERLAALANEGLVGEAFLDLGGSARFYRFDNTSAAAARAKPGLLRRVSRWWRGS